MWWWVYLLSRMQMRSGRNDELTILQHWKAPLKWRPRVNSMCKELGLGIWEFGYFAFLVERVVWVMREYEGRREVEWEGRTSQTNLPCHVLACLDYWIRASFVLTARIDVRFKKNIFWVDEETSDGGNGSATNISAWKMALDRIVDIYPSTKSINRTIYIHSSIQLPHIHILKSEWYFIPLLRNS